MAGPSSSPSVVASREVPLSTTSADIMRSDQHHDVVALCLTCLVRWLNRRRRSPSSPLASTVAPVSLEELKAAWVDLKYSHIYSGKPKSMSSEGYMQQLYDGCFQVAVVRLLASDVERVVGELREAGVSLGEDAGDAGDAGDAELAKGSKSTEGAGVSVEELTRVFNEDQRVKDRLALFAMWCCFGAQPVAASHGDHEMVLVRVEERYFDVMQRWTGIVEEAGDSDAEADFALVYASMWKRHAFVFGSNMGYTPIQQCLGREETDAERELTRDLRFHITTTLKGMGIGHVQELCGEYASSLNDVLVGRNVPVDGLGDDPHVGIADLEFGKELGRLVDNSWEKMHYQLYGDGGEGRLFAGMGKSTKREERTVSKDKVAKVMMRQKERKLDIQAKKRAMEEAMGLECEGEGEDEGEDMPDLDGLAAFRRGEVIR